MKKTLVAVMYGMSLLALMMPFSFGEAQGISDTSANVTKEEKNTNNDDTVSHIKLQSYIHDEDNGFSEQVTIQNPFDDFSQWVLQFKLDAKIKEVWNARYTYNSFTGVYKITNALWNGKVKKGDIIQFGYSASGKYSQPYEITLNGQPLSVHDKNVQQKTSISTKGQYLSAESQDHARHDSMMAQNHATPLTSTVKKSMPGSENPYRKKIVHYMPSWAVTTSGFNPTDIPGDKLTHLVHAFADISSVTGKIVLIDAFTDTKKIFGDDTWDTDLRGLFSQYNRIKRMYPHLKSLIAVGGWFNSGYFSEMAASPFKRKIFINSVISFLKKYNFDGIDLNWEHPVVATKDNKNVRPSDGDNYAILVKELRYALDRQGKKDNKKYIITAATSADYKKYEKINLRKLGQYLDFFNVISYDFHGRWVLHTGHHAPLYNNPVSQMDARYNVHDVVHGYMKAGVPPEKIVVGIPAYGYAWTGVKDIKNGLHQKATSLREGPLEEKEGYITYNEIDAMIRFFSLEKMVHWDDRVQASYLYAPKIENGLFITYDNPRSVRNKLKYIDENKLGGVMMWKISDDIHDFNDKNNLLNIVSHYFKK